MFGLEKLANWWDTQKKESEKGLDSFVDAHPNLFGVAVAGSAQTAMDLGQGFVDVLRVGEGVKKGGWGYAEDALRVVSLAGPVTRVGRLGLAKLVQDVPGPMCARVSTTQALRMTGTKHFATVEDVIKSLAGKVIRSATDIERELWQLRANTRNLGRVKSWEHMKDLVSRNPNGVTSFGVKWVKNGEEVGHSLVGYRNWIGRVRFLDRTGTIFGNLEELEKSYRGIQKAVPYGEALHIANSAVVTAVNGASAVGVEMHSLMLTSEDYANRAFDEFRNRMAKSLGLAEFERDFVAPVVKSRK